MRAPETDKAAVSPQLLLLLRRFQILFLFLLVAFALIMAGQSLFFRIQHDGPMVLYPSYLFINGYGVPYKDIFDINFPGSFLLYGVIGKIFGYSDMALRALDIALLILIGCLGYRLVRPINHRAGIFAAGAFGLFYVTNHVFLALQRETFILLFALLGAHLLANQMSSRPAIRYLLFGFLAGFCMMIKPQALLAFLWIFFWDVKFGSPDRARWLGGIVGFLIPTLGILIYMNMSGAMGPWLDMVTNYLPLYAHISGDITIIEPGQKLPIIVNGLAMMGGYYLIGLGALICALLVMPKTLRTEGGSSRITLLVGLLVVFWIYPAFAGQFWIYHWLPFVFFALLLLGLAFSELNVSPSLQATRVVCLVTAVIITSLFILKPAIFKAFAKEPPPKQGRVDEMVEFLKPLLKPGDAIQPLDWTGGAVHAMLILRARMATRYMQDFYFYHHVSDPYIQNLRKDFIEKFAAAKPRFIIRVLAEEKPWVKGPDTTRSFPELETILSTQYHVVKERNDYQILERNPVK